MRSYEVNFIVDPVLSGDEIKTTAEVYKSLLTDGGSKIVNIDELGLKQLRYPINKRSSGVYYCIEFSCDNGDIIPSLELAFRRDERIMRFLTVKLDKYGVKFNDDKRKGLVGKKKPKATEDDAPAEVKAEVKKQLAPKAPPAPSKQEEE